MDKYKICPVCGMKNHPAAIECEECEADLTGIRITDDLLSEHEENASPQTGYIRLCDCGHKNPGNARKCENCGEDISDIVPSEDKQTEEFSISLASIDGSYAFLVPEGITEIGKEQAMSEYLGDKPYVSRKHGRFIREAEKLFYENLSQTNFSFINNEKKVAGKCELHDGDELGLGGNSVNGKRQDKAAYFIVRIGSCL